MVAADPCRGCDGAAPDEQHRRGRARRIPHGIVFVITSPSSGSNTSSTAAWKNRAIAIASGSDGRYRPGLDRVDRLARDAERTGELRLGQRRRPCAARAPGSSRCQVCLSSPTMSSQLVTRAATGDILAAVKLATIRDGDRTRAVRVDGDTAVDIGAADVGELLRNEGWRQRAESASGVTRPVAGLDFAPLIPRPEKIICVGLNYRNHILETGRETSPSTRRCSPSTSRRSSARTTMSCSRRCPSRSTGRPSSR